MKNWRNKLISLLLTLVMVVGMIPLTVSVFAAMSGYTAWTSTNSLPSSGTYYLNTDVQMNSKVVTLNGNLSLDLNGHTITFTGNNSNSAFIINGNYGFDLYDSVGGGKIEEAANAYDYHRAVWVDSTNAYFYMHGGTISGFHKDTQGSGVCVNRGKMIMDDGEICNNTTTTDGGAVMVASAGTFEMKGGKIHDNTCGWTGGGIASGGGTVNISGGEIYNNTVTSDRTNEYGGGGIGGWDSAKFTVSGTAKIYNNTANIGGGVVLIRGSSLTMTGGEIYDNTATVRCSGVGTRNNTDAYTVTVSGSGKLGGDSVSFTAPTGTSTVSFDQNGGVGGQTATVAATWGNAMLAVAVPTKDGAGFVGYFDKDGTKYYNADGTSAKTWDYFNTNVTLYAEWGHLHNDSGTDVTFEPWIDSVSLPTSGSYYLMKDVTLNGKIALTGNLHLDLNGHTVKFSGSVDASAIDLGTNKNFYLYDCVGGGKLLRTGTGYQRCVWVSGGASFYMYGGTITGFKNSNQDGGAVCVNDGTMYMYGGAITDCQGKNGGAIYVSNNKKLYIYGGEIANCQGINDGGAVIARPGGTVEMSGGKIHDNTCGYTGAGISSDGGTVTVSGGEIYNNTVTATSTSNYGGGGIGGWNKANFTVSGTAKIYNNTANYGGGVVLIGGSSLTMTGGEIGPNTATVAYSGVGKINNTDSYTVTVSGSGKLDSNSISFTAPTGTSTVTFDQNGGVGGQTAKVTATWGEAMPAVAVPTNGELEFLGYFDECGEQFYNGKGKSAKNWDYFDVDVTLYAKWKTPLKHSDFTDWTSTNSLPNKAGNYCLTGDVTCGSTWTVPSGEVNLCLHGHSITFTSNSVYPMVINKGSTLNLYDFTETVIPGYLYPVYDDFPTNDTVVKNSLWHKGTAPSGATSVPLTGGYITFTVKTTSEGCAGVRVTGGTFNMYGGNFAGCYKDPCSSPDEGKGSVVQVGNGGSFNMYGNSTITGCAQRDWHGNGGGHFRGLVAVGYGGAATASMNDNARMQYCTAFRDDGSSRGIVSLLDAGSQFIMNDNSCLYHCVGDGAAAFVVEGANDAVIMNDNSEVSECYSSWCSAVHLVGENSRLEMYDNACIHDCVQAGSDGRALILMEGTNCALYMYDNSSITDNTGWAGGAGNGYIIQLASNGSKGQKLYVCDSAQITGNMAWDSAKKTKTAANVYLNSGAQMIVLGTGDDAPKDGMNVGVALYSTTGKFSTAADIDYSDYFQSDRAGYGVFRDVDKQLEIGNTTTYKVHLNLNADNAVCDAMTSYTYQTGATLPIPDASNYVFKGWYIDKDFKGSQVTEISKTDYGDKTFYAKWQSVTDEHLESGNCDSNGGKGEIMGHQKRSDNPEIGRVIIPLTQEQLKKVGDTLVIVGGDQGEQTTFEVDCAYTYFYDDDTMITAESMKCAAFVIIEKDGYGNDISGYGYYRIYNGNENNFMFDVMYKKPNN